MCRKWAPRGRLVLFTATRLAFRSSQTGLPYVRWRTVPNSSRPA
jgi:hypothetical protein